MQIALCWKVPDPAFAGMSGVFDIVMAEPEDSELSPWEDEAPERDTATADIFGEPEPAPPAPPPGQDVRSVRESG